MWRSVFLAGLLFPRHRRWEGRRGEVLVADVRGEVPGGALHGLGDTPAVEEDFWGGRGRGSGCSRRSSRISWRMLVRAGRRFIRA